MRDPELPTACAWAAGGTFTLLCLMLTVAAVVFYGPDTGRGLPFRVAPVFLAGPITGSWLGGRRLGIAAYRPWPRLVVEVVLAATLWTLLTLALPVTLAALRREPYSL